MTRTKAAALALSALFAGLCAVRPAAAAPVRRGGTHILTFGESTPPAERRRIAEASGASVIKELPLIEGLLVQLPGFSPNAAQLLRANERVESLEPNTYRKWLSASPAPLSSVAIPSVGAALDAARGTDGLVPRVGPAKPIPQGEEDIVPWGIARVKAPQAWARTKGKGARVAVIDTGIDFNHPDLAPNYGGGHNVIDPNAKPFDDHGHGTHVAGTIGAAGNGLGVVGVAPEAKLYAVKVLDAEGGGDDQGIVDGIQWAVDNKMHVINMSLGGPSSAALRKAVKAAVKAGVTVVAAAGNDPSAPVSAPASYPESIAVSASTKVDKLASFSTTGPEVDFIGPGHQVQSDAPGGKLATYSGTSMATPHVAGLAALAVALGASGPDSVRAALQAAAVPLPGLDATQQGAGLVEADRLGGGRAR